MEAEVFVPIAFFATIFAIIYIVVRKKERLTMIERGADPNIFRNETGSAGTLKWGLFSLGIGLGILAGNILVATTTMGEEVSYFSMIFLFGGISLIINHFLSGKLDKK